MSSSWTFENIGAIAANGYEHTELTARLLELLHRTAGDDGEADSGNAAPAL